MKKIITVYVAFILCAFSISQSSCNENPVDKQLDITENIMNKFDRLLQKGNPTKEELKDFRTNLITFDQSIKSMWKELDSDKLTQNQRMRMLASIQRGQRLINNPGFVQLVQRGILNDTY